MVLQSLTEHQIHIFGGIAVLAGLFFGLLGLLIYLDKRGVNTHLKRPKPPSRREQRREKKSAGNKRRKV